MTRWFSADLHLGDPWVAKRRYCGDDVAKHNAWLASRWDKNIKEFDDVWLLGDVVRGMSLDDFTVWLAARPGRKHLVMGNWDVEAAPSMIAWGLMGFMTVTRETKIRLSDGTAVRLSHYPNVALGQNEVLFHGHTHRKSKSSWVEGGPLKVHVGWDAWRRYVPEADLVDLIGAAS